jgi:hypothetical protein
MTSFTCPQCDVKFTRKFNRDRHFQLVHNNITLVHNCSLCGAVFNSVNKLKKHHATHNPATGFTIHTSAFRKKCVIYRKIYEKKMSTLEQCIKHDEKDIFNLLHYEMIARRSVKVSIIYHAEFYRVADDDGDGGFNDNALSEIRLRAPARMIVNESDIYQLMRESNAVVQNRIDDFLENGSGWALNGIGQVDLELGNCRSLNGACNLLSIKYIKSLKKIKTVEEMETCFLNAIAFHFIKSEKHDKLQKFIEKHINMSITSPVAVKDIPKFEAENKHLDMKINVLYCEKNSIFPIYFSKAVQAQHHITLLLYKTMIDNVVVNHYSYVEDVNKLLRKKYTTTGRDTYEKTIRCLNCFAKFTSKYNAEDALKKHYELCLNNKPHSVKIPQAGDTIKFRNFRNKFKSYYMGFFDFESAHHKPKYSCEKCEKEDEADEVLCPHKTSVQAIQKPITVSFLILDWNDNIVYKETYTGDDCVEVFFDKLLTIESQLLEKLKINTPMELSKSDVENFNKAVSCHICETELWGDKVRDHCHITGVYLGAAHNSCNLLRSERKKIPMFCHNLTGYDGHFLVQKLGDDERITSLKALPYNSEKFRTIEVNSYLFLDSLSFLNASLGELMNDLTRNEKHPFKIIDQLQLYPEKSTRLKKLLLRKGVYPYEYVTNLEKLKRTKCIPKKKHFFSTLSNSNISQEDYIHAKRVFKHFKCENMIDYTELYCAMDVGILAEVVSQFRELVFENFGLDCW